eukprot:124615-Amphidinium_carterae.1
MHGRSCQGRPPSPNAQLHDGTPRASNSDLHVSAMSNHTSASAASLLAQDGTLQQICGCATLCG